MVYRGKPSAGCENCRKAKKRCTLELPACVRCVKLKKECVGYRDTTQLQIQDETQSVLQKVGRKKSTHSLNAPVATTSAIRSTTTINGGHTSTPWQIHDFNAPQQLATPPLTVHEYSSHGSSRDKTRSVASNSPLSSMLQTPAPSAELKGLTPTITAADAENKQISETPELKDLVFTAFGTSASSLNFSMSNVFSLIQWASGIPKTPRVLPDHVAIDFFLKCCTAEGQWSYFHQTGFTPGRDSCLDFAIKACGMAALNNVRPVPGGREWSRSMYTKAIGLLNSALRDPARSKTDDTLVSVSMLSFYENLVCDSMLSITSWKAHIEGATQLLKVRGKAQFDTMSGRQLFRELRAQIMIACIWDDRMPPMFLKAWQVELKAKSTSLQFIGPIDELVDFCFKFAELKSNVMQHQITGAEALECANQLDADLVQWAIDTPKKEERWQYSEIKVAASPHVWQGTVYAYSCLPIPGAWNMYRAIRVLLSRTSEVLSRSLSLPEADSRAQVLYLRAVRRQMTDEICATLPCLLGHASPAFSSPCVLVTAYNSVWPIFFAATCSLERLGLDLWEKRSGDDTMANSGMDAAAFGAAAAQSAWLLGRLDYISSTLGVKWADGIAGSLRKAIQVHKTKIIEATSDPKAPPEYLEIVAEIVKGVMAWRQQLSAAS